MSVYIKTQDHVSIFFISVLLSLSERQWEPIHASLLIVSLRSTACTLLTHPLRLMNSL